MARESESSRQDQPGKDTQDRESEERLKKREEGMDKTLADSYPASDPPSTIPDPDPDPEGELPEEQKPKGRDEVPEGQQSPVRDNGKDKGKAA